MNSSEHLARLSAIILSSEDAIISKNLEGIIDSWNPSAELIFGYTAEEVIGKHISLIIPDELLQEEDMIISEIKSGGRISHYETIRKRKDGSCLAVSVTVSPIRDENDQIVGASKIVRDITEQKLSERSSAILSAIIDSSDDAIVSKNLDGIITSWNKGAENIFGFSAEEATGRSIAIIIPDYKLPEEADIIEKIRRGERVRHFETIRRTKGGKEINISVTISPVKDKSGKIIGASKIARNITERVELEKQRKLYLARLQELNNYKDEFLATVSHELKTPLTVIKGNMQMLQQFMDGSNKATFVDKTMIQVDKLINLISDLFDVSKINAGKLELKLATFSISEFLRDIITNIQQITPSHQLTFIDTDEPLLVVGDRDKLEQVVINLLTNAVKYSPGSKVIKVSARLSDNKVVVDVEDFGIGISQEETHDIFSRFFRGRDLPTGFQGLGIGLYISQEIINRHGGNIEVKSELGKGSTFSFSIPAANPQN